MYMDHLLDLEMYVAEKNKIRSVESLERSTRGIGDQRATRERRKTPVVQANSKVTSHHITSF